MKLHLLVILAVTLITGQLAAQDKPLKKLEPIKKSESAEKAPAAKKVDFKNLGEKMGYIYGTNIGSGLKMLPIEVDVNMLARGIRDAIAGNQPALSDEQIDATVHEFQQAVDTANKKQEETFLANNKKKEGVKALPSGLQYKVLKKGTGSKPKSEDTVVANYRGTLLNGAEFDSSYKRGEPLETPVTGVIKGWTEALQLMEEGAKWELYVPAKLAYGERGNGAIGPNTMLIFEIELLKVAKQTPKLPKLKLPEKE
jgi:FKBP-type peptidyl-prolyl cis-trans isomerase